MRIADTAPVSTSIVEIEKNKSNKGGYDRKEAILQLMVKQFYDGISQAAIARNVGLSRQDVNQRLKNLGLHEGLDVRKQAIAELKRLKVLYCTFPECPFTRKNLPYCRRHMRQLKSGKKLTRIRVRYGGQCKFPSCPKSAEADRLCFKHYFRYILCEDGSVTEIYCNWVGCKSKGYRNMRCYCEKHYKQLQKEGTITIRKYQRAG